MVVLMSFWRLPLNQRVDEMGRRRIGWWEGRGEGANELIEGE